MLNKLLNFFKKKSFLVGMRSFFAVDEQFRPTNRDYLEAYESSFITYTCVRKIAEKLAVSTELKLYKVGKDVDEIEDHPILDLLAKVNPNQTRFELLDNTQTYIELLGNAYWLKIRDESGEIIQIEQLRPDWVKKKHREGGGFEYEYQPSGEKHIFQGEDVIHFTQPNPKSHLYGLPTVKPAMELIRSLVYSVRMEMNAFLNNARPDFFITSEHAISSEEKEEFERKFKHTFQGVDNVNKVGIFSGSKIEIKEMTRAFKDLGLTELNEQLVDHLLATFGVPRGVVGLKGMNRAEAEQQMATFLSETIEPKIKRIVEKLNEFLVPEFGEGLFLDYEDPSPENRESLLKEYETALTNHWMVINEVRDKEGLPPLDGGWDFYLPISMVPAGSDRENNKEDEENEERHFIKVRLNPTLYEKWKEQKWKDSIKKKALEGKRIYKAKEKMKANLTGDIMKFLKSRQARRELNEEQKANLYEQHLKSLVTHEKLFGRIVRGLFRQQRKRASDAVESQFTGGAVPSSFDLLDWDTEVEFFKDVSTSVFMEIIKDRGQRASDIVDSMLGDNKGLKKDFLIDAAILTFINNKAFKFARFVNNTTKERIREQLQEGVLAGESIDKIGKRIDNVFVERLKPFEIERIARTEVLSASEEAQVVSWKQSGVVQKKEWLTVLDERARDSHVAMHGEIVGLDDTFSNGMRFPGDFNAEAGEIINCRCDTLPILE